MFWKAGPRQKWRAPAAMVPTIDASCTSDRIDNWHYTHLKSTCWKRNMTTTMSFHSSKLLYVHTAMFTCTTWRNNIRITGTFIRKITKLELFNHQWHPVLHPEIAQALRKFFFFFFLSSVEHVMLPFSHVAILSLLYFWCALVFDTQVLFFFFPSQAQAGT